MGGAQLVTLDDEPTTFDGVVAALFLRSRVHRTVEILVIFNNNIHVLHHDLGLGQLGRGRVLGFRDERRVDFVQFGEQVFVLVDAIGEGVFLIGLQQFALVIDFAIELGEHDVGGCRGFFVVNVPVFGSALGSVNKFALYGRGNQPG